jgi:N-acetylglucosaminyl-diphospho-decaprenol L-rhamnosyltransferase
VVRVHGLDPIDAPSPAPGTTTAARSYARSVSTPPPAPGASIGVVILTYRPETAGFDACFASVLSGGGAERVVVVDNGQQLTRADLDRVIGTTADPPAVDLLSTEENLGFAGGMNAGLSHALEAGLDGVAILNDDTVVEPGWLSALAAHLGGDVGAVQPLVVLGRGDAQEAQVLASRGMWVRGDGAGIDLGYGEPRAAAPTRATDIELFTGGAVLLSRALLESTGGFDERYFLYYEDIDLARRGRERGWRYLLEPSAVVHHAHSATASADPGLHRYWQERNRLWWLARHGTPWQAGRGFVLSLLRLAKHPIAAQWRAIVDGLRGAPTARRERRARPVVSPLPRPVRWQVR